MATTAQPSHPRGGHARKRLLDSADVLFYERGINTVGVNELVEHAGVAKTSLYLHFASKDELVAAYLTARVDRYVDLWREVVAGLAGKPPEEQIDGIFGALASYARADTFFGCPFWRAVAEINNPGHAAWESVLRYRNTLMIEIFRPIVDSLGFGDAELLACQFVMLYDAALSGAFIERTALPVERGRLACHSLIAAARLAGGGA
jgi:AcrR family transcriptional regulator